MRRRLTVLGAAVLVALPASAGEVPDEADLVRSALASGVARAHIDAIEARGASARTPSPLLDNPVLEVRHEQANGPAGASTDILGGTVLFGLGGGAEARAARLRGQAAEAWTRAEVVGAICTVRRDALDLWLAAGRSREARAAQERLQSVLTGLTAMAEAGEVAGYDRDRLALSVAAHRHALDAAEAERLTAVAGLSARTGNEIAEIALLPLTPSGERAAALENALSSDPVLEALRTERQAAERAVAAARRAALPQLALSGGARWDAMPDGSSRTPGFEVGAGLSLPVFDRNQGEIASRGATLAALDARIADREAAIRAAVAVAWERTSTLGPVPDPPPTAPVWQGALDRYAAGEATIEELLAVAADLEAAAVAAREGEALRRAARLDLSCTVGAFPEPAIQALLEEQTR